KNDRVAYCVLLRPVLPCLSLRHLRYLALSCIPTPTSAASHGGRLDQTRGGRMHPALRTVLFVVCAFQAFFAIAFFVRLPIALHLWPWAATSTLSYIFISSIFAAAAASTLWSVWSNVPGALAGIALDYLVIFVPMAAFALHAGVARSDTGVLSFGI